jgi:hypothetical protein
VQAASNTTVKCLLEVGGISETFDACTTLSGTPGAYTFHWSLLSGKRLRVAIDSTNPGGYTGGRCSHCRVPSTGLSCCMSTAATASGSAASSMRHPVLLFGCEHASRPSTQASGYYTAEPMPVTMLLLGCRLGRRLAGRQQDGAWQWRHRQGRRAGAQRGVCGGLPPRRLPHPRSHAAVLLDGHRDEGAETVLPSAPASSCLSSLYMGAHRCCAIICVLSLNEVIWLPNLAPQHIH